MSELPDDLVSTKEACTLLPSSKPGRRLHISTVLRWIFKRKLRGWRIAGRWFVSRRELLALARCVQPELEDRARGEVEARARAEETDRVLREAGIRR